MQDTRSLKAKEAFSDQLSWSDLWAMRCFFQKEKDAWEDASKCETGVDGRDAMIQRDRYQNAIDILYEEIAYKWEQSKLYDIVDLRIERLRSTNIYNDLYGLDESNSLND